MKRCIAILLALLVLTACAAGGEAPATESEGSPSSVSEAVPAPAPSEPSPAETVPGSSSVPEEVPSPADVTPPEPDGLPVDGKEINPDTVGPQDNVDTSGMYTDEENAAWQKEFAFVNEIDYAFIYEVPKESYSYYSAYGEGSGKEMQLVLEIGITDEAALDAYLSAWTGTKWDKLVKKPGSASQAKQEEFAEKASKLDIGPNTYLDVQPDSGSSNTEYGKILVSVSGEHRKEAEQAVKALAKEMGIPEDMLSYLEPRPTGPVDPDGTVTNPDT